MVHHVGIGGMEGRKVEVRAPTHQLARVAPVVDGALSLLASKLYINYRSPKY